MLYKKIIETAALKMTMKRLIAFDFDHTIIDDNSDTAVMHLLDKSKISKEVNQLRRSDGWTVFMQEIFKLLQQNNKTESDIVNLIKRLPPVNGIIDLINDLYKKNYDIIIISDSNSFFIDIWLKQHNLNEKILEIFTNPARFIDGLLKISMYHLQDTCKLSTKNLCKGQILDDFLHKQQKNGINYQQVIYCGDGKNDFCPILRLKRKDLACVRANFKCIDFIRQVDAGKSLKENGERYIINARVFVWNDGYEILKEINKIENK